MTTARSGRFAIVRPRIAACVLGIGLACGLAAADAGAIGYTSPASVGGPPPRVPAKPPPVIARIIAVSIQGSEMIITIAAGSNSGITKDWTAQVLRGDIDEPLPGGAITIVRVDKAITVAKVRLTGDQIKSHSRVKLSPP